MTKESTETNSEYFGSLSRLDFGPTEHLVKLPLVLSIQQAEDLGKMLLGAAIHQKRVVQKQKPGAKKRSLLKPITRVKVWINTIDKCLTVNGLE